MTKRGIRGRGRDRRRHGTNRTIIPDLNESKRRTSPPESCFVLMTRKGRRRKKKKKKEEEKVNCM